MKVLHFLSIALFGILLTVSSCTVDEPEDPKEEEVITTLRYTLTPTGGGDAVTFEFQDIDGDGGDDPIITNGTLTANTSYTGSIELLNEATSPVEDVTVEIRAEKEDHQFFYTTTATDLTIGYTDFDADNNPVGLETAVNTSDAGNGTLTIVLRHEPDKLGTDVINGDITNAGGETDIEVTFDVTIQ
ncbi:MAG: type 1 periplasmic binding fold superfamily protein [Saprospiraceae bacterium]